MPSIRMVGRTIDARGGNYAKIMAAFVHSSDRARLCALPTSFARPARVLRKYGAFSSRRSWRPRMVSGSFLLDFYVALSIE